MEDGERFTIWTSSRPPWLEDEVNSTFTLDRPGAGVAKVNALLRDPLPKSDSIPEWVECDAGNVNNSGMDGSYYKTIAPTLISDRWLAAVEHGEYYCGGAHPENRQHPTHL